MKNVFTKKNVLIATVSGAVTATATYLLAKPSKKESEAVRVMTKFAEIHNLKDEKGNPDLAKAIAEFRKANGIAEEVKAEKVEKTEKKAANA